MLLLRNQNQPTVYRNGALLRYTRLPSNTNVSRYVSRSLCSPQYGKSAEFLYKKAFHKKSKNMYGKSAEFLYNIADLNGFVITHKP